MNNIRHLNNLTVLVTRPAYGGEMLCEAINLAGGTSIHFPTIMFTPPNDLNAFHQEIAQLDRQDWLIFISPQAVYASHSAIQKAWQIFPWQVKVAAVGAGTATALQKVKLPVHVFPSQSWNSEGILDLPEFQQISGKKIVIIRGEGGRPELAEILKYRGAVLSHIIAYKRCKPTIDTSHYENLIKTQQVDVMVCASGEGLLNLKEMLKNSWLFLQFIPLIVVSPRLADLASNLGFKKIFLAKNASHNAIMETLNLMI
jgi:uroporphyrinogen-III synthase